MFKAITIFLVALFIFSCSASRRGKSENELPACLDATIKSMIANPNEGSPLSVTRYKYKGQLVFYMVSPCCDKYNVVYDTQCNVVGYPDGGYMGKGDGKMTDFKDLATDGKMVWQVNNKQANDENN